MKDIIYKNLNLRIDFQNKKTVLGSRKALYLIGVLPVCLIHGNGKKEIGMVNDKVEIETNNPDLKKVIGSKATNDKQLKPYRHQLNEMVLKLERTVKDILSEGRWKGKPIRDLLIINL